LRLLINIFLFGSGALALWGTIAYIDWMNEQRLSGVAVIALLFYAIAILGINMQLSQDFLNQNPGAWQFLRRFLYYYGQFLGLVVIFLGGLWLIIRTAHNMEHSLGWIPSGWGEIVAVLGFISYVGALLRLKEWADTRKSAQPTRENDK
jgi:uncharacterized membrane protein